MSKADQLGSGRFGGAGAISSRRAAIGAATGVPTEGVAPPTKLPVSRISPNPDNPRTSLGDLTELGGSLEEHGQKQAITVMNRDAYVRANPQHEQDLEPDTTHVVVDGSSRLAAAREVGLTHLKVMVDDDQGADAEELLESALVANVHRQALEPLDEAQALQRLLAIHGTQTALAKRLHKSQGWVSQRLALLNLTPDLKERVGQEPVDLLRAVGNKPADQQAAALDRLKQQQALEQAAKAARRKERGARKQGRPEPAETQPDPAPEGHYDVIGEPEAVEEEEGDQAERMGVPVSAEAVPVPRTSSTSAGAAPDGDTLADDEATPPPRLPYHDGYFIAQHLIRKMPAQELDKVLALLSEHQQQRREPSPST